MEFGKQEKILSFYYLQEMQQLNRKYKTEKYAAYVTSGRLNGSCLLCIIDYDCKFSENFELNFNCSGLTKYYSTSGKRQVWNLLNSQEYQRISYQEALLFLGDAVKQNYKYGENLVLVESIPSIHLERCWQQQWTQGNRSHILNNHSLTPKEVRQLYFQSLAQQDGALFFELLTVEEQQKHSRDNYLYIWSHPLEKLVFLHAEMEYMNYDVSTGQIIEYLMVKAKRHDHVILEIDLRLDIIHTHNGYRLVDDWVGEVRKLGNFTELSEIVGGW